MHMWRTAVGQRFPLFKQCMVDFKTESESAAPDMSRLADIVLAMGRLVAPVSADRQRLLLGKVHLLLPVSIRLPTKLLLKAFLRGGSSGVTQLVQDFNS